MPLRKSKSEAASEENAVVDAAVLACGKSNCLLHEKEWAALTIPAETYSARDVSIQKDGATHSAKGRASLPKAVLKFGL